MPINRESKTWKRVEFNRIFGSLSVYAWLKGIPFIVTSYTRTAAQQNALFKKKLSNCDGYKKTSYHQLDRARDIAVLEDDGLPEFKEISESTIKKYEALGEFWESLGGTWGGRWKSPYDIFHFQY